jgi:hypothetical protein
LRGGQLLTITTGFFADTGASFSISVWG